MTRTITALALLLLGAPYVFAEGIAVNTLSKGTFYKTRPVPYRTGSDIPEPVRTLNPLGKREFKRVHSELRLPRSLDFDFGKGILLVAVGHRGMDSVTINDAREEDGRLVVTVGLSNVPDNDQKRPYHIAWVDFAQLSKSARVKKPRFVVLDNADAEPRDYEGTLLMGHYVLVELSGKERPLGARSDEQRALLSFLAEHARGLTAGGEVKRVRFQGVIDYETGRVLPVELETPRRAALSGFVSSSAGRYTLTRADGERVPVQADNSSVLFDLKRSPHPALLLGIVSEGSGTGGRNMLFEAALGSVDGITFAYETPDQVGLPYDWKGVLMKGDRVWVRAREDGKAYISPVRPPQRHRFDTGWIEDDHLEINDASAGRMTRAKFKAKGPRKLPEPAVGMTQVGY